MSDEHKLSHDYAGTAKWAVGPELKQCLESEARSMAIELRTTMARDTGALASGVEVGTEIFEGRKLSAWTAYVISSGVKPGFRGSHAAYHEFDDRNKFGGEMQALLLRRGVY